MMYMPSLDNIYLENAEIGNLVCPSSSALRSVNGGNYLEKGLSRCTPDSELFPAIVLDPQKGQVLSPSGIKYISKWSIVSRIK